MERMHRNYLKEEEFLEHFDSSAREASKLLNGDWKPNYDCNDNERRQRDYFRKSGELTWLVFSSGSVFHDENGHFSSVQIVLESLKRQVNVRVSMVEGKLVAEKIVDREPPPKS